MSPAGPPNPFESIPPELLRSNTPTPSPSPDASSTVLTPPTPTFPSTDSPLLSTGQLPPDQASSSPPSRAPSRSFSSAFVSSPLNPNSPTTTPYPSTRPRPTSRGSIYLSRIASEESHALGSQLSSSQRGSMILYRLATVDDHGVLLPPNTLSPDQRESFFSTSGESIWSLSSDSKYPSGPPTTRGGLVPYVYDPSVEDQATDEEDLLHEPDSIDKPSSLFASRGILNIGVLVILIVTLLALFIAYPVITYVHGNNAQNLFLDETGGNTVTDTSADFAIPGLIDSDTPDSVKTRTGYDDEDYVLVFSDEFNTDGRSFNPGVDPNWEAVDLSDGDLVYYESNQVYTANGSLHIRLENVSTNGATYLSGMLQSWNKFCFTSGYIEVSVTLPGRDQNAIGYWAGVRTMGNLGRPGYGATLDGTWPYTYDSCDVGTFPNQTDRNGLGPAAALQSNASQAKYDYRLSYLTGQKLSACTCPGEDHPGPNVTTGRGAPEIDILEAGDGAVVSQSALFAPFTHDYVYLNDTEQEWYVYNPDISQPNSYKGSPLQQDISGITQLPGDIYDGSGQVFHTFGLEYFANPVNRSDGYIIWQMDDTPTVRMGAGAVGPDQGPSGSGVSQRLIPEEPMSIVLNLGISPNSIDLSTLTFPTEMLVDYVRVYQRKDSTNVGCNPLEYPTTDYISRHQEAYTNPQLQVWTSGPSGANNTFPKNSLYNGGC